MSVPLSDYVRTIPTYKTIAIPGYPKYQRIVLTKEVQQLMRRMVAIMPDLVTNKICFLELKAENFMVDTQSGRPSLHAVSRRSYDKNLAQTNYASVEKIFRETIFSGAVAFLPPDFQKLLGLMKTKGHKASYVIQHHCSLAWAIDKKDLFNRIYDTSYNIIQKWNNGWYNDVMNNLDFPINWDFQIRQNQHLAKFYKGGSYNPVGPNAGSEVLRCKRNSYSHCLLHAWNMKKKKQIYDQAQLVEMMETVLPLVLHSYQVALHDRGLLKDIALDSFFH